MKNKLRVIRQFLIGFCIVSMIAGLYFISRENTLATAVCFAIGAGCGLGVQILNYSIWPEKYYPKGMSKKAVEADNPLLIRHRGFFIWLAGFILFAISLFLFFYRLS